MAFTPDQQKEYRKQNLIDGKCPRCKKMFFEGAHSQRLCVNCHIDTLQNKQSWRFEKKLNGERYT